MYKGLIKYWEFYNFYKINVYIIHHTKVFKYNFENTDANIVDK